MNQQLAEFEAKVGDNEDDDVLTSWIAYKEYADDHCPGKSLILMNRCFKKCENLYQCKNDVRFLKLYLEYAEKTGTFEDVFERLKTKEIGVKTFRFYDVFSRYFQSQNQIKEANDVFLLGMKNLLGNGKEKDIINLNEKYKIFCKHYSVNPIPPGRPDENCCIDKELLFYQTANQISPEELRARFYISQGKRKGGVSIRLNNQHSNNENDINILNRPKVMNEKPRKEENNFNDSSSGINKMENNILSDNNRNPINNYHENNVKNNNTVKNDKATNKSQRRRSALPLNPIESTSSPTTLQNTNKNVDIQLDTDRNHHSESRQQQQQDRFKAKDTFITPMEKDRMNQNKPRSRIKPPSSVLSNSSTSSKKTCNDDEGSNSRKNNSNSSSSGDGNKVDIAMFMEPLPFEEDEFVPSHKKKAHSSQEEHQRDIGNQDSSSRKTKSLEEADHHHANNDNSSNNNGSRNDNNNNNNKIVEENDRNIGSSGFKRINDSNHFPQGQENSTATTTTSTISTNLESSKKFKEDVENIAENANERERVKENHTHVRGLTNAVNVHLDTRPNKDNEYADENKSDVALLRGDEGEETREFKRKRNHQQQHHDDDMTSEMTDIFAVKRYDTSNDEEEDTTMFKNDAPFKMASSSSLNSCKDSAAPFSSFYSEETSRDSHLDSSKSDASAPFSIYSDENNNNENIATGNGNENEPPSTLTNRIIQSKTSTFSVYSDENNPNSLGGIENDNGDNNRNSTNSNTKGNPIAIYSDENDIRPSQSGISNSTSFSIYTDNQGSNDISNSVYNSNNSSSNNSNSNSNSNSNNNSNSSFDEHIQQSTFSPSNDFKKEKVLNPKDDFDNAASTFSLPSSSTTSKSSSSLSFSIYSEEKTQEESISSSGFSIYSDRNNDINEDHGKTREQDHSTSSSSIGFSIYSDTKNEDNVGNESKSSNNDNNDSSASRSVFSIYSDTRDEENEVLSSNKENSSSPPSSSSIGFSIYSENNDLKDENKANDDASFLASSKKSGSYSIYSDSGISHVSKTRTTDGFKMGSESRQNDFSENSNKFDESKTLATPISAGTLASASNDNGKWPKREALRDIGSEHQCQN